MALFAYSTSNVLAASLMPNNVATAGTTAIGRPIDAPLFVTTDCSMVTEIPTTECDVLVVLYTSTTGAGWTNNTNWNVTNTPCSWSGIACDIGHVAFLNLGDNMLSGTIPSFSGLNNLKYLFLSNNQFAGNVPDLLASLTGFYISNNLLNGSIPTSLTSTAITAGFLSLYGTGNILIPADANVNSFIAARITGWPRLLCAARDAFQRDGLPLIFHSGHSRHDHRHGARRLE